ncbi:thymine dioxygenase [Gaeumannomyces tritici R3-111a-1]|uniref:Thymine dioxygenase n=1 Tax=Gaeumannomyces tritici (strain R3-111a-1) TaxID=644352 RepID=J3PJD9_GAET3|nr:thymine dioxygenase [Gaeumannomyces tritici R3-111a-1]EJT68817.1 thymine dioxygenase [Gaeumannomyces tritici R3-111a-1]
MTTSSPIPVVDFAAWYGSSPQEQHRIAQEIADACRHVGFVQISNHGVSDQLVTQAFAWSTMFFSLPLEKKKTAPHLEGAPSPRGYSWPGLEKVSQAGFTGQAQTDDEAEALRQTPDFKESFDVGSDRLPGHANVWPPEEAGGRVDTDLAGFRAFMTRFYSDCSTVGRELMRALAMGVGLPPDEEARLLGSHTDGLNNQLRLLHYPPVAAAALERGDITRMPAHTDWGTLTMLFQDDCGGLQVENPSAPNTFVDATPIKGAMVMNVGDSLMRWTNNRLKSTLHRVVKPAANVDGSPAQDPDTTPPRHSIVYFNSPDPEAMVECFPSCISTTNRAGYLPMAYRDYMLLRSKGQY